ncbi:hypothetical protein A3F00_00795 [Candidatus Daviesbacteria bacterium RIFCSPHIGHO2_12_FULL_37_11]|uniref:Uncharacterized protein n=1 Tax=Candidatus Daviesbacteria bacterium RIFCSPHIGHO2_12_FULL_37_11 TaxID=1797777 RepID=A0A1F5KCK4_9BACT|nr:MAG: hypothetical protein A2111_00270 [Candidatus Daviesbacteria bacterium GWA1_38_6]OGE18062.1 MAG: hypothetical protein A2769_00140 [Candidatus Daviesbacteria bacterium RIFCSPHIGHO2_01_FULL_37_27]OGE38672.1 MAG: hypothetical protein A3F00_00795 [Candidatus Daviesbacteria bacterium RIFCSPHIGHO2_12_FULL_37_11]OGE45945.1 MAG: hypothetical protein A3B39_00765 [Candidatus Daviesbacteria bacterium RIFCSPLOWO2_01_FULL_37_10]
MVEANEVDGGVRVGLRLKVPATLHFLGRELKLGPMGPIYSLSDHLVEDQDINVSSLDDFYDGFWTTVTPYRECVYINRVDRMDGSIVESKPIPYDQIKGHKRLRNFIVSPI